MKYQHITQYLPHYIHLTHQLYANVFKPYTAIYYHIDIQNTIWQEGYLESYDYAGDWTAFRWVRIDNFPLRQSDQVQPHPNFDQKGIVTEGSTDLYFVVTPVIKLRPLIGDFVFITNVDGETAFYNVTNVEYSSTLDQPFYRCVARAIDKQPTDIDPNKITQYFYFVDEYSCLIPYEYIDDFFKFKEARDTLHKKLSGLLDKDFLVYDKDSKYIDFTWHKYYDIINHDKTFYNSVELYSEETEYSVYKLFFNTETFTFNEFDESYSTVSIQTPSQILDQFLSQYPSERYLIINNPNASISLTVGSLYYGEYSDEFTYIASCVCNDNLPISLVSVPHASILAKLVHMKHLLNVSISFVPTVSVYGEPPLSIDSNEFDQLYEEHVLDLCLGRILEQEVDLR